jgi:hypothetical protein
VVLVIIYETFEGSQYYLLLKVSTLKDMGNLDFNGVGFEFLQKIIRNAPKRLLSPKDFRA